MRDRETQERQKNREGNDGWKVADHREEKRRKTASTPKKQDYMTAPFLLWTFSLLSDRHDTIYKMDTETGDGVLL